MNEILKVSGAVKSFSGISALKGVNLSIRQGEIIGLIGASNSGKSVLLDAITGIVRLDSGRIHFRQTNITDAEPHTITQAGITRTFKYPKLFPDMTIRDHLLLHHQQTQFWHRLIKLQPTLTDEQSVWLGSLGLLDHLNDLPKQLSSIQQHRLEVAMAIMPLPYLILMDEPFTGYPQDQSQCDLLISINQIHNTSLLLVDHQLDILRDICHRVIIINSGEILAQGNPDDILTDDLILDTFYLA